jgi:hypothetical protein
MKIPEKHYKAFDAYNEDRKRYDEPWKLWEFADADGPNIAPEWVDARGELSWGEQFIFRRKPATVTICGVELPEPVREPLEDGEEYWVVELDNPGCPTWISDESDKEWLDAGRIHLSEENARAWGDFFVRLMSGRIGNG